MRRFTLFPYFGGKFYLVNKLVSLFPQHKMYVEPFCGSAVILLNKKPSFVEVINDKDDDIINLFNVVKYKMEEFYEQFRYTFTARTTFYRLADTDPSKLTDVERAFRFFYLQKHAINGIPKRRNFKTSRQSKQGITYKKLKCVLNVIYERIKDVKIENTDYKEIFRCYDAHNNFFYLDPPYQENTSSGRKREYAHNFNIDDFRDLKRCCLDMKGKFLMSINNTPFIRKLFKDFNITTIAHTWGTKSRVGSNNSVEELLVSNYDARVKRYPLKTKQGGFNVFV